ncbi:hypothetical protein PoB_001040300 [Plakobranchus ocellatus]|uniref:Uncharacterized protein n=1 Tax=Plakobranchus ocellatus TaxID=259542 RepID=A0AAV3YMW4_9GAST|nr:hypothetical protein PoB_001040300 [Plakobranchus ocellatus]
MVNISSRPPGEVIGEGGLEHWFSVSLVGDSGTGRLEHWLSVSLVRDYGEDDWRLGFGISGGGYMQRRTAALAFGMMSAIYLM